MKASVKMFEDVILGAVTEYFEAEAWIIDYEKREAWMPTEGTVDLNILTKKIMMALGMRP